MNHSSAAADVRSQLRARADALARTHERSGEGETIELLEFRLAQERYAVETRRVRGVYPLRNLTLLPSAPAFIGGIVNVRGRILPVLDLKEFFALPAGGLTDLHRVIHLSGHGLEIGVLADVSVGVTAMAITDLHAPPAILGGVRSEYVKAVSAGRLIVIDVDRLLSDPRIIVNEQVED